MMSIDSRYEGFLCDLVTLFEEMAIRLIHQKQIDLHKFKHLFNQFYDRMQGLESSFHQNKLKITKYLERLRNNTKTERVNSRSFDQGSLPQTQNNTNKPIPKPFIRSISAAKPNQVSKELISIEEEDDEHRTPINDRRSETAGGFRRTIHHSNKQQYRPKTGISGGRRRYMDTEKAAKTINMTEQAYTHTEYSQQSRSINRVQFVLDDREIHSKRKNFYLDLEKQKSKEGDMFSEKQYKQIFKKYKGKANQRIWQKISRLF